MKIVLVCWKLTWIKNFACYCCFEAETVSFTFFLMGNFRCFFIGKTVVNPKIFKAAETLIASIFVIFLEIFEVVWISSLKACLHYLFFHQMIAFQKLWKMLVISSKKLIPFLRYSNLCNFFPSFSHFPSLKGQIKVE